MKKILALVLAVTMLALVLCACGQGNPSVTTESTTTETTTGSTETTTTGSTSSETTTKAEETTTKVTPVVELGKFDSSKIVLSFGALSDVHLQNSQTMPTDKFYKALNLLKDYAIKSGDKDGIDAVMIAGDLTQTGQVSEAQSVRDTYKKVFDETKVPLLFATGNHEECYGGVLYMSDFRNIFGESFFKYDLAEYETDFSNGSRLCKVGDYYFIFLQPDSAVSYRKVNGVAAPYKSATKEWLRNTLEMLKKNDPEKPIFVFTHPMIYHTVYGSELYTGDNLMWYTTDLTDILSDYPQVMTFSGHLHFPLNDPKSIMQTDFTSLGCGSVRYMAIENGGYTNMKSGTVMNDCDEFSQGFLVQVDENGNVRLNRMDFYNETTIGEAWEVSHPVSDNSHLSAYPYTRAEKNTAPVFPEDAITIEYGSKSASGKIKTTIKFKSAMDDEFAHHYILSFGTTKVTVKKTVKILADFYRHGDPADMKKEWEYSMGTLTPGSEYEVSVIAVDSWGAKSEKITKVFTVEEGKPTEPQKTEIYADIDFADGKMTDTLGRVTLKNNGASVEKIEVSHAGKKYTVEALHATKGKYVIGQFNELTSAVSFANFAEGGFSVEAFYVTTTSTGKVQGIVCGTQAGGWGLAEQATGQPYFITGGSGGLSGYNPSVVASSASSNTELTHVVATYDFEAKKSYIYVNGKLAGTAAINTDFKVGGGSTFNYFCLGDDITSGLKGGDFPVGNMIMTDAKIYKGALTAAEASTAYTNAVASLSK